MTTGQDSVNPDFEKALQEVEEVCSNFSWWEDRERIKGALAAVLTKKRKTLDELEEQAVMLRDKAYEEIEEDDLGKIEEWLVEHSKAGIFVRPPDLRYLMNCLAHMIREVRHKRKTREEVRQEVYWEIEEAAGNAQANGYPKTAEDLEILLDSLRTTEKDRRVKSEKIS